MMIMIMVICLFSLRLLNLFGLGEFNYWYANFLRFTTKLKICLALRANIKIISYQDQIRTIGSRLARIDKVK